MLQQLWDREWGRKERGTGSVSGGAADKEKNEEREEENEQTF